MTSSTHAEQVATTAISSTVRPFTEVELSISDAFMIGSDGEVLNMYDVGGRGGGALGVVPCRCTVILNATILTSSEVDRLDGVASCSRDLMR